MRFLGRTIFYSTELVDNIQSNKWGTILIINVRVIPDRTLRDQRGLFWAKTKHVAEIWCRCGRNDVQIQGCKHCADRIDSGYVSHRFCCWEGVNHSFLSYSLCSTHPTLGINVKKKIKFLPFFRRFATLQVSRDESGTFHASAKGKIKLQER